MLEKKDRRSNNSHSTQHQFQPSQIDSQFTGTVSRGYHQSSDVLWRGHRKEKYTLFDGTNNQTLRWSLKYNGVGNKDGWLIEGGTITITTTSLLGLPPFHSTVISMSLAMVDWCGPAYDYNTTHPELPPYRSVRRYSILSSADWWE